MDIPQLTSISFIAHSILPIRRVTAYRSSFISPLSPPPTLHHNRVRRPPICHGHFHSAPSKRMHTVTMLYDDNRKKPRRRSRPGSYSTTPNSKINITDVIRTARSAWVSATPTNRIMIATFLFGALSLSAAAFNIILHISFIFAFALVPIILAPLLLTVMTGIGLFIFLATATAGAGFFFVGTPFFLVATISKALLPVFITAGVMATVFNSVMKASGRAFSWAQVGSKGIVDDDDDEYEDGESESEDDRLRMKDELDEFDSMLNKRTRGRSLSRNVENWDLNHVVDELDQCGLGRYRQLFIDERIDGHTLLSLSEADIRAEFADSMPLGDRRRLARLVSSLRGRS